MPLSIAALFYGDYPALVRRLLSSLGCLGTEYIADCRLGLHQVSPPSRRLIEEWTQEQTARGVWVGWYEPESNIFKYPTMRRMLADPRMSIADGVIWLDDDSYFQRPVSEVAAECQLLLEKYWLLGQYAWYSKVPGYQKFLQECFGWSAPVYCRQDDATIKFCIGGWWVGRRELFLVYDFPVPILRHKGGDWLLSALCTVHHLPIGHYDRGIVINADLSGKPNITWRRGVSRTEPQLGYSHTPGRRYDTSHQHFATKVTWYGQNSTEHYTLFWDDIR